MFPCGVQFKKALGDWGRIGVNFNRMFQFIVAIAKGCAARIYALCCFFAHSLLYFFPQIVRLVFSQQKMETVN